ncbi:MAG: MarR family transcriptional regulator [Lentisphaerae bacterium]|nr:MarR family transcriptional regulator [Lentisphaerota bacterium]
MISCYGHYHSARLECGKCAHRRWCITAGDPALLLDGMSSFDEALQDNEFRELVSEQQTHRRRKLNGEKLEYSRNDLLEVIVYMLNLDPLALELLDAKIHDPDINLSEIARKRKTSRQAVQQALKRKCQENPEIARLLANRECKNRKRKQSTFMEAVCQIRRQNSPMKSNVPVHGLKYYRSLNSWNQNFDLSKMSIIKGSSICQSGWQQ